MTRQWPCSARWLNRSSAEPVDDLSGQRFDIRRRLDAHYSNCITCTSHILPDERTGTASLVYIPSSIEYIEKRNIRPFRAVKLEVNVNLIVLVAIDGDHPER
jgi:hypothetical protein